MDHKLIEQKLNNLIKNDTRPHDKRDLHQKIYGVKRTNITKVEVISMLGSAIQDVTQTDPVANSGVTTQGILQQLPLTPTMVNQGQLSDCYLLASILSISYVQPSFFNDIVYAVDSKNVIVQYWLAGSQSIVRIHTSLLVSTSYDNENSPDVRIELLEKTYGLMRAGVNDYYADNFGNLVEAFSYLGLDTNTIIVKTTANVSAGLAKGQVITLATLSNATGNDSSGAAWVPSHMYAVRTVTGGKTVLQNPWHGGVDLPTDDTTLAQSFFWGFGTGAFPTTKRLIAPIQAVTAIQTSEPIIPMTIISTTSPTILNASLYSSISNCSAETQANGMADIGYVSSTSPSYVEYTLVASSNGSYSISFLASAISNATTIISVNGAVAGNVSIPSTGSWGTFSTIKGMNINLVAGNNTLRFTSVVPSQYNLGAITLAPATSVTTTTTTSVLPVKTVKQTIVLYTDGTYTIS